MNISSLLLTLKLIIILLLLIFSALELLALLLIISKILNTLVGLIRSEDLQILDFQLTAK
jgi:hypothetical protein